MRVALNFNYTKHDLDKKGMTERELILRRASYTSTEKKKKVHLPTVKWAEKKD